MSDIVINECLDKILPIEPMPDDNIEVHVDILRQEVMKKSEKDRE